MPNSESSPKTPLSQEVENPSSFDFSIPTPEDSPSTLVCGAGEMDESFTPQTEVTAFLVPLSDEVLVCSPTLVLSGDKSHNSEAQSVAKPSAELLYEETESTISERLFEGHLLEGKGPDSCILTVGAELVVVQSLASLRGDTQSTLLDQKLRSPDQNSRGMRGGNKSQENVPELETVKGTPNIAIVDESAKQENERQRKEKGKLNSEIESDAAAKYVAKRRREVEEERVKFKGDQKGGKKSLAKRVKVTKQTPLVKGKMQLKEQPVKGPGPRVKNQIEEKELTREERIEKMEKQRVLNVPYLHEPEVREFFYKMELLEGGEIKTIIKNVDIHLDEETLGIILGVPVVGI
ncbi:hypothetical protein H5410_026052 [Solanum commersonii]|uniref:Uncharacterized protein n=1 Tax=Solanum commersonii TaxID=4109 RepID=A0A9J5YXM1_SOLCO|nr:hypothetical protein H5410_026052 [Solanum commersonii]